ncbi:MAG: Ig-like domain-containing domain [Bacteroidota bacterium]|nr:Ig-like domain-containing domain [Bacteroidota bacterium]
MRPRLKYIYNKINVISTSANWHISTFVYLLISTLIYSCAQVVAPGGGEKDITPPKVVKYIPDSASLNFKSKSIVVFFDEFIQLKDLNNQLIISPPLEKAPDIKVRNKMLTIDFDKEEILKPNTTYSISFGNALQDIHENNPIDNFKYIFSTGSFIDSLVVKGKIENAFDHKTDKGILVMLYTDFSDSVIYKKKPDYFAKTKEDGTFQINNIRAGKYKLLVLKDANANYKYDSESESVGFIDALIDVAEKKNILIDVFQEPSKKLFLKKNNYNSYGKISFIFNKPADSIRIEPLNLTLNDKDVFLDYSKNKDTLNYWFRKDDKDSIILQVKNGNTIIDTVDFKIIKKEDALKSRRNPLRLVVVNSPAGNQNVDLNAEFKIVFNNPLDPVLFNNITNKEITLLEDTIPIKDYKNLFYTLEPFNTISINSKIIAKDGSTKVVPVVFKENTSYHLFIPPGAFTDIFGLTNDTIKIDFKTREEKFYGTLKLNLDIPATPGNYIVQLLDEKESIVKESNINKSETLFYEYLYPKKYKLKIIYDNNANYKWDTGNLLQKLQPEKVIYNAEPVNTRPNWDLELEWKIIP